MEIVCRAALRMGMEEIAITDHVDFEPLDECHGYFKSRRFWRDLQRCRDLFGDWLTIRAGAECGESHRYAQEVERVLSAHPYDFVLGSIHWAAGRPTFHESFFDGLKLDEGLGLYFDVLGDLAEQGDYDVLAHLDIIRRAAFRRFGLQELDLQPHEERIRRVLRAVAQRGKGVEINTSTQRRGMGPPGPPVQVLRWFRQEGGQIVTLGSDAHRPEDVGADLDLALDMMRQAGFERPARFERRRTL